jgi:hypothetical protein
MNRLPRARTCDTMRCMRLRLLAPAAFTVVALGSASPASATIVVGEGMAGAKLGMSKDEVRAVLGKPTESRSRTDDFGRTTRWYFKGPKIHVTFRDAVEPGMQATAFMTRRGFERTSKGVGVGSSITTVRARVSKVKCERFPGFSTRSCHVGEFLPGKTVTDFRVGRSGKVGSVLIGYVID